MKTPVRGRVVLGLSTALVAGLAAVLGTGVTADNAVAVGKQRAKATLADQVDSALGLMKGDLVSLELDATPMPARQVTVPIAGADYTLDLRLRSVRTDDFQIFVDRGGPELVEIVAPPVRTMIGTIAGDEGSSVRASVEESGLYARVKMGDGREYWVEPVSDHVHGGEDELHVVYETNDVLPTDKICGAQGPGFEDGFEPGPIAGGDPADGGDVYCTDLALDIDNTYRIRFGGVSGATARAEQIINGLNGQYLDEVSIEHDIVTIIVREVPTYTTSEDSTLLNQFRSRWLSDHSGVQRDIAHLFTGRSLIGGTIGIAWLGQICASRFSGLGFGLVQDYGGLSCRTDLSAHELGHNWNAGHCDPCSTTMRSFIGCFNTFTSSTRSRIISHRNSRTCLNIGCPVPGPPNDDCADAFAVGDGSFDYDTTDASNDGPGLPEECREGGSVSFSKDVWYEYTATCDGIATASTCGASYNSRIAVYDGTDCPPSTVVACNDDACTGNSAETSWAVTAGEQYLVRVGGRLSAGTGTLVLTCVEGVACPEDIDGSGTIDAADLVALLAAWGPCPGCPEDINDDDVVDAADLVALIAAWGPCP
jgi:hypothetical protein